MHLWSKIHNCSTPNKYWSQKVFVQWDLTLKHKQASCGIIRSSYLMREFAVSVDALVLSNNFSSIAISWSYHIHNPVDLTVLGVNLVAHVESHVAEVTDDTSHLLQILIHFILSCIICYPEDEKKKTDWIYWEHWLRWAQYLHQQPILLP